VFFAVKLSRGRSVKADGFDRIVYSPMYGEVSERLKEHAWKVCIRQRIEGSNPSLTAIIYFLFISIAYAGKRYAVCTTLCILFEFLYSPF
jgi:hypothetical protein